MRRFFDLDSPLMRALARFTDLLILNLLTIICSLPVITMGAAVAALYGAMGRLQNEEGHTIKNYFSCFKENFWQATWIWLILLPIGAIIVVAFLYYANGNVKYPLIPAIIVVLGFIVWASTLSWALPLQSRFYNSVKGTLRNALICSVAFLWRSLIMTVLNFLPFVLFFAHLGIFLALGVGFVLVYFSGIAWINLKLLKKAFQSITPTEEWAGVEDEEDE